MEAKPYSQGILYYLEPMRDYIGKIEALCLPCMFILLFGNYTDLFLGILGDFCF